MIRLLPIRTSREHIFFIPCGAEPTRSAVWEQKTLSKINHSLTPVQAKINPDGEIRGKSGTHPIYIDSGGLRGRIVLKEVISKWDVSLLKLLGCLRPSWPPDSWAGPLYSPTSSPADAMPTAPSVYGKGRGWSWIVDR